MWSQTLRSRILSIVLLGALIIAPSTGYAQPSHANVVASKKTILLSRGEDLSGPCGAFKITREVAADPVIRAEGWGLVASTGNGCPIAGIVYRADTLMQPNGLVVDLLRRAESDEGNTTNNANFNIPTWDPTGNQDPTNWRAPLASVIAPVPNPVPTPTPTPTPQPVPAPVQTLDLSGVYERIRTLEDAHERQYLDLAHRVDAVSGQVAGVSVQVKEHDEKVSVITSFFKDGKTWTGILGILGGYLTQRYMAGSNSVTTITPTPKP